MARGTLSDLDQELRIAAAEPVAAALRQNDADLDAVMDELTALPAAVAMARPWGGDHCIKGI